MGETEPRPLELAASRGLRTCSAVGIPDVIPEYYRCFNQRRFVEGAALFADHAVLEQLPLRSQERGGIGYLQFVSVWLGAFPDAVLTADRVSTVDGAAFEIDLTATGSHRGALHLGGWIFRPTGANATFRLRELLQVESGRIVSASVSFDLHEIVDTLTTCDVPALLEHLQRLQGLRDELEAVQRNPAHARKVVQRIGTELDATRHVVRPYYKR